MQFTPIKFVLFFALLITSLICCIACDDTFSSGVRFDVTWPSSANIYHANSSIIVKPHRFPFEEFRQACSSDCDDSALRVYTSSNSDTAELSEDGDLYDVEVRDETGRRIELFKAIKSSAYYSFASDNSREGIIDLVLPHPPGGIQPPILDGGVDAGLDGGAP